MPSFSVEGISNMFKMQKKADKITDRDEKKEKEEHQY